MAGHADGGDHRVEAEDDIENGDLHQSRHEAVVHHLAGASFVS